MTLRDGTPAVIWPLLPNDARGLRENFAQLSADSRYNRFISGVATLSDAMLSVLVDEVDGVDHIALVLAVFPAEGPDRAVGVGRLIRYPDRPMAADVAVTVVDEWQGRGVATALLSALVKRRPAGVVQLVTQVTTNNHASIAMLARLGIVSTQIVAGQGVYDVTVDLSDPLG